MLLGKENENKWTKCSVQKGRKEIAKCKKELILKWKVMKFDHEFSSEKRK